MGALLNAMVELSPAHDAELLNGYQRYETLLETILTPQQLEDYAAFIRQAGEIRIFEELTPAELASLPPEEQVIATAIMADENISMENRRVVALLNQRGQHAVAPDLHPV
jgi:hypothetical protein